MTARKAPLVGMKFRPGGLLLIKNLPAGARLTLVPEPENPYDGFAVKVMVHHQQVPEDRRDLMFLNFATYGIDETKEEFFARTSHLGYVAKTHSQAWQEALTGSILPRLSAEATLGFGMNGPPEVIAQEVDASEDSAIVPDFEPKEEI